jgi:CHAD domain-containing protein
MPSGREQEVKLGAWGGFVLPDLDGVVDGVTSSRLSVRHLDAVYYDTADLRLARWGVSLRHRTGDADGWTVKLPEGEGGPVMVRREVTFDAPPDNPPPPAVALVRGYSRGAGLTPVARLKTRRSGVELLDAEGHRVAEVVDDEVSVYQGRRLAARFREVEVELGADAPPGLLAAVVACLRAAGAGEAEPVPKVVRALGPKAFAPPEPAPVDVGPDSTVAEAVRGAVAAAAGRIISHDPGVRLGDDPEDVHQARVGTRRLRSDLRTFRPLLDRDWVAGLRDEASWLADLLGGVRDAEVLAERLTRQAANLVKEDAARMNWLLDRLADDREAARARLVEAMNGPRYVAFLQRLVEAAAAPAFVEEADAPARDILPPLVRRPWRRLRKAVQALPPDPADPALHEVRILAKHTRYASEAAAPVVGRKARALAKAVAGLQGVLGDHQDAVVAEEWLRGHLQGAGPGEAMVLGQLIGIQRAEAAACRAAWPDAWHRASAKKLRDWLP